MFVHGYGLRSTGDLYRELLDLFEPRHTVYALDLRGHGASAGAITGWSLEALADDIATFSRALALERPVFVGHSFGAVIGLLSEIRHPGTFSAMCLLSPGPADHRTDPVDTLDFLIEHGHDRDALRGAFRQMFLHPPGGALDLIVDAVTLMDVRVHRAQKMQDRRFSIDGRLNDVAAPVLLMGGGRDRVVPPARQHDMAGKLSRCKEVFFSRAGHMLAIENAAITAREVLGFLAYDTEALTNGRAL